MIYVQEAELQGPLKGRKPPQPLSSSKEGFGSRHSSASAPAPWHPLQMLGPGSYSWGQVGTAQEQDSFLLPVLPL